MACERKNFRECCYNSGQSVRRRSNQDRTVASGFVRRIGFGRRNMFGSQETTAVSGNLSGKVVEIDDSGNLITDILGARLIDVPRDASLRVVVDEHETFGLFPVDHSQPAMTLVAVVAADGPLKIVLVGDSASAMLGVRANAPVEMHW